MKHHYFTTKYSKTFSNCCAQNRLHVIHDMSCCFTNNPIFLARGWIKFQSVWKFAKKMVGYQEFLIYFISKSNYKSASKHLLYDVNFDSNKNHSWEHKFLPNLIINTNNARHSSILIIPEDNLPNQVTSYPMIHQKLKILCKIVLCLPKTIRRKTIQSIITRHLTKFHNL